VLKWAVLVNPLVYMSEGFRAALTNIPHMSLVAVYAALIGFTLVLVRLGLDGFRKRVLT
jgi:ABC-2 type transport system permease protein